MQNTMREIPFKGSRKLRKYHKARVAKFDVEMKANTTWEEMRTSEPRSSTGAKRS